MKQRTTNNAFGLLASLALGLVGCKDGDNSALAADELMTQGPAANDGGVADGDGGLSNRPCVLRPGSACAAPCVPITGRRYSESQSCFLSAEAFLCDEAKPECAASEVLARDALNHYWRINTKCIPSGWSAVPANDTSGIANRADCN